MHNNMHIILILGIIARKIIGILICKIICIL